jgi:hypothetical protein
MGAPFYSLARLNSMHVTHKPRAVAAPIPAVVPTLMRTAIALLATATLLWMFTPSVVHAQEQTGTHEVQAGENLWSLAVRYYGDGQKWTELAKLNDLGGAGEKGLVVGQSIKYPKLQPEPVKPSAIAPPANTPRNALARARQPIVRETPVTAATGALAAQTSGKSDAAPKSAQNNGKPASMAAKSKSEPAAAAKSMTRPGVTIVPSTAPTQTAEARIIANSGTVAPVSNAIWNIDGASIRAARGNEPTTVFLRRTFDAVQTDSAVKSVMRVEKPRNRTGEFASAPFAIDASSVTQSGKVGRRTGAAGGFRDIERLVLTDEAEVVLPPGVAAAVGAQFVSVQLAPITPGGAKVATPTGVLEVIKAEQGHPVIARVMRQSGRIEEGQPLLAFVGGAVSNSTTAVPVARSAGAPETHVIWVESDALLPTLQSFVLLAATEHDGVKAGDEFALVKRSGLGADAQEKQVAVVRVVRVTALGTTAIVIRQSDASIAVGSEARLIARAN